MKKRNRLAAISAVAITIGLLVWAFRPKPIKVETGRVTRGTLRVTVDEEGETRVHDRFDIATPVTGRLRRIELHAADPVEAGQIVARVEPLPLDPREHSELLARLEQARANQREADALVERAQVDRDQARRNHERTTKLQASGVVSREDLEFAETAQANSDKALEAARFKARAAEYEVQATEAGLIALESTTGKPLRLVSLRAPVRGHVLRLLQQSERVITSGTPILQVGHPSQLEIVSDLLSTEAVKVKSGDPVFIENWGGDGSLRARVRTIESSGFTKISALGVEEQRVNIVMDFVDPPGRLGDGYRVDVRIIVWQASGVLTIPTSALFRHGEGWNVFVVEHGRARTRDVELGHRNALQAEITKGLTEGTVVVLHPGNQVADGVRVSPM